MQEKAGHQGRLFRFLGSHRRMKKLVTFLLGTFVVFGCATVDYTSRAMGLRMDMTKEQVVGLMGPPKRVSARKASNGLVESYSWWSPKMYGFTPVDNEYLATDRMFVRFLDGKVVEWGDKLDFSEAIEKSRESQAEALRNLQIKAQPVR
jgi:hypothetical protein